MTADTRLPGSDAPPASRASALLSDARADATRLWLARALAWSLLFGGWTVLGALGHEAARAGAPPGLPLAAWLASIGLLLAIGMRRASSMRALSAGLAGAALLAAGALSAVQGAAPWPLLGAAFGWAALLVLASREVKALRARAPRGTPAPIGPALVGAAIAWSFCGDPLRAAAQTTLAAGWLLATAALLLALAPRRAPPVTGCSAGLFDCSLPLPRGGWGHPADWPLHAAALAMLPMMAALPAMAERCASDGFSASAVAGLHLASMVGPAWLLRGRIGGWPRARLAGVAAALLGAGGLVIALGEHRGALLAGMLLHGTAWSLAWAGPMLVRVAPARAPTPAARQWVAALATAAAVALLASAVATAGTDTLRATHMALAVLGLSGLVIARGRSAPMRG
jgi:hypothetical protein